MRVQVCSSCGARYNVERLPPGSVFECRRCGADVRVGGEAPPARRFSLGLLVAGTLMLAALFLQANPSFGSTTRAWPWEGLDGAAPATTVGLALWALAGLWALVSALGIAPRSRSLLTVALAGVLLIAWHTGRIPEIDVPGGALALHVLLSMIVLGAGLALLPRPGRTAIARALAFGGGIALVWLFAFDFGGGSSRLQDMVDEVGRWLSGDLGESVDVWRTLLPDWALLLAGVVGVIVGFGAGGRFFTWTGIVLLLVGLVMPTAAGFIEEMGTEGFWDDGTRLAEIGRDLLIHGGLALFLLGTYGLADLAGNRKAAA